MREAERVRVRAYYEANRQAILDRSRQRYESNREQAKEYAREEGRRLRREMLSAYGGRCACCGEAEQAFLCLDHEFGNGAEERRVLNNGKSWSNIPVLRRLRREGWPKDGYRILCANCNMATMRGRVCPHQIDQPGGLDA